MFGSFRVHPATQPTSAPPVSTPPEPCPFSIEHDKRKEKWNKEWSSLADFTTWLQAEQSDKCIDFGLQETRYPKKKTTGGSDLPSTWLWRREYRCGRQGTGGVGKGYEKKHPERKRKVESKRVSQRHTSRTNASDESSNASFHAYTVGRRLPQ